MIEGKLGRVLLGIGATCAIGCSSAEDPLAERRNPGGGEGGMATTAPDGGTTPTEGAICEPVGSGCEVRVVAPGAPTGSGAECLAMRDNAGADHVQLRQTWNRITEPAGNAIDTIYSVLLGRAHLALRECNMKGVTGYIKLVDWDRSGPAAEQTARVGWADFEADSTAAVTDGLCMAELDYVDPDHGLDTPWAVAPVTQRRVDADFTVDEARAMAIPEGEGIFYFDEASLTAHHYSTLEHVIIFDNKTKVSVVPIHDAEMTIRYNDDTLNCAGAYRADAMKPEENDCFSIGQQNPPWGCSDGDCPTGEGPVRTTGWFLITELEQVFTTVLNSTLCVSYPGQQVSIDQGWADPSSGELNCSSSPMWDPMDPVNGIPRGDWCSETNAASTDTCHDAWRSNAFGVMSAFNVKAASCQSEAIAAGSVQK